MFIGFDLRKHYIRRCNAVFRRVISWSVQRLGIARQVALNGVSWAYKGNFRVCRRGDSDGLSVGVNVNLGLLAYPIVSTLVAIVL